MRAVPIDPCDEADLAEFVALAERLDGDAAWWVPPLRQPLVAELTGRSGFARHGRQRAWLAEDGGRVVGRVVALVDPRQPGVGQVGYFACEDSLEAARTLLDAACAWLAAEGARQVLGPMNGGAHRLHRFMIAGFERDAFLFEPRNPPHHPRLFEACGFRRVHTWATHEVAGADLRRLHDWVARGARRAGALRAVTIDPHDPATLPRLHRLLDGVWAGHPGYASIDEGELAEALGGVLAMISPRELGGVLDPAGRDLGLGFMYPDVIDEVRALRGDAAGWGRWPRAGARARRLVMHTFAFLPEARGTGAPALLLAGALRHMLEDGHEELVLALASQELHFLRRFGAPTREYALFGKGL